MSTLGAQLLTVALRDFAVAETLGGGSSAEILAMAQGLALSYTKDEVPWCGLAIAHWTHQVGLALPEAPLASRSWLSWGAKAETPELGDVTVLWRGAPSNWEGHVGLFVTRRGALVYLLGGNQGNAVTIVPFNVARVLGYRRAMLG